MTLHLQSVQNPRIKHFFQLREKSRVRKQKGVFLIEGVREISLAIKGNYVLETVLYCAEISQKKALKVLIEALSIDSEVLQISSEVYQKLAYRRTTEGVLAVAKSKEHSLSNLNFRTKKPLVLVAEAPEKPGNIGALLRTADAAGIDAIIIANPTTDLYNPNIIRSSVGCLFTTPIATGINTEIISFLKDQHISIYCATLQTSIPYTKPNFLKSTALVVGTEATGLSEEWLAVSDQNIKIPMAGVIDSMNVSVAAGILIFEAVRQRNSELF